VLVVAGLLGADAAPVKAKRDEFGEGMKKWGSAESAEGGGKETCWGGFERGEPVQPALNENWTPKNVNSKYAG